MCLFQSFLALASCRFWLLPLESSERHVCSPYLRSILHGLCFGTGATFSMLAPVSWSDGVIVDARAIVVGLAAAFGGWPAAAIATAMAASYRFYIGGVGAPSGAVGICAAALLGLLWVWRFQINSRIKTGALIWLGGTISLSTTSVALLPSSMILSTVINVVPLLSHRLYPWSGHYGAFNRAGAETYADRNPLES